MCELRVTVLLLPQALLPVLCWWSLHIVSSQDTLSNWVHLLLAWVPRQGICIGILPARSVMDVQLQLLQGQSPASQRARWMWSVQEQLQCLVVLEDMAAESTKVWPEVFYRPDDSESFQLHHSIVLFIPQQ